MKTKTILLFLLCIVGISTATAQSDVYCWKDGKAVKMENLDSLTFTAPASGNPQVDDARALAEATTEDIGKIIGEDGKIYATKEAAEAAGITAVAMIAYVGNDAETSSTYRHGLALALKDVSGYQQWCSKYIETCLSNQYSHVLGETGVIKGDMAGLANTDALVYHSSHTHAAATAARNYQYADGVAEGVHPVVTSAWFLPSAGQWDKMATAVGGYAKLKTNAGLQTGRYWSSSEFNRFLAWDFSSQYGTWWDDGKAIGSLVRPCLAF